MNLYKQWTWLNETRTGKTIKWSFVLTYFYAMLAIGVGGLTLYNYLVIKAVIG